MNPYDMHACIHMGISFDDNFSAWGYEFRYTNHANTSHITRSERTRGNKKDHVGSFNISKAWTFILRLKLQLKEEFVNKTQDKS